MANTFKDRPTEFALSLQGKRDALIRSTKRRRGRSVEMCLYGTLYDGLPAEPSRTALNVVRRMIDEG